MERVQRGQRSHGYDVGPASRSADAAPVRTEPELAADRVARFRVEAEQSAAQAQQLSSIHSRETWSQEKEKLEKRRASLLKTVADREKDAATSEQAKKDLEAAKRALEDLANILETTAQPRAVPPVPGEVEIEPAIQAKAANPDDVMAWAAGLGRGERTRLRERLERVGSGKRDDAFAVALANYLAAGRLLQPFRAVLENPKRFNLAAYEQARARREENTSAAPEAPTSRDGLDAAAVAQQTPSASASSNATNVAVENAQANRHVQSATRKQPARGPTDAPNYFSLHESKFFDAIRARLSGAPLPVPHERLQWVNGGAALAAAFEPAFNAVYGFMYHGQKLPEVLYPIDPFDVIDRHRELVSGQPGEKLDGKLPEGSSEWSPVAGQAIAIEFERALRASLPRMGLRYVTQADDYHGRVGHDMLVASAPMDLVVARLLCDPHVARYVPDPKRKGKSKKGTSKDTDRPDAFRDGIRLVYFEWQGERDRKLWNCIKVEPADARPEEVSASLFEQQDGKSHTEYAYGLIWAAPFYIVPPQWARRFPAAAALAPEQDEASPLSALDLADSTLADEIARTQAGKPVAKVDRGALAHMLATSKMQLQLVGDLVAPWKLFHHVGPSLRWVTKHADAIDATPDATLGVWAAIAAGMANTLPEATGEIVEVLELARSRGIEPSMAEGKPVRDVLEAYATAMGESHLQQTAAAQLSVARHKKALLPVVLLESTLLAARDSASDLSAVGAPADRPKNTGYLAKSSTETLEAAALDLRASMIAGGGLDVARLETLTVATAEQTLSNRLMAMDSRSGQLLAALGELNGGVAAGLGDIELTFVFPTKLREIQATARSMLETMRLAAHPQSIPADPAQAQKAFAEARKKAVTDTQRWLAELEHREDTRRLFQRVADKIADARVKQMIADVALLIGISIVGAMAGSFVGGLVRGTMLSGAAVDSLAFGQMAAHARTYGMIANVVTDATVQAVGQTSVFGGDTKLSFAENLMASVMTLGALRPIHRATEVLGALDNQAMGMWKVASYGRVALVHAGTFTTEMLVGAGAGFVAARIAHGEQPKDNEQATSWALQGAAMAVGHFVSRRMGGIQERLAKLGEHGAHLRKRAEVQLSLARKLETSGNTEQALQLLEEHTQLLKDEAALLNGAGFVKRAGLDAHQVDALRAGNGAALTDTGSQAYEVMKLRFIGLEPIAANGLVWSGDRAQIELVFGDASGAVKDVARTGEKSWTAELGGRRVSFVERDRDAQTSGRAPTAEEAEHNRAIARRAIEINARRSQQITTTVMNIEAPKVRHITVGEGVAGTLSHASQTNGSGAMPGPVTALPEAIAISDGPDWWQNLGDRDIGQPVGEWNSAGFRRQPGEFNHDHKNLGRASDVAYATAMTALESGMVTVRGRITAVEEFTGKDAWPVSARWRVLVDDKKWVYSETIAFAGGLGRPNKHPAFKRDLEQQLRETGRMTDAQTQLMPPIPEGGTLLVIGGGGTAGWAAQEAVRTGRRAIVITLDASLRGVPPHVRKELDAHHVQIIEGIVNVATYDGTRVVLTINAGSDHPLNVSGDGVSLAVGQMTQLPRGMENQHFRMQKKTINGKERVVGLEAYDPSTDQPTGLVIHGAAMTTPPFKKGPKPFVKDRDAFVAALAEQARDPSVPEYSRGVEPSIYQSTVNIPLSNEKTP